MKKTMKKLLAVVLTLAMLSTSFICFAEGLNQDAVNKHYGQYKNYLLLGDSVACGYRDEMSEDDKLWNDSVWESTYYRVPGSYADVLANAIIADKSMTALAAPGFRTIEMRYMLEDDYRDNCTDEYLFWPSHLYAYENIWCECHGEPMLPGSEHFREAFKKSIAEADLISLGIGGNDWGAYLGWVFNQILKEENVADQYINDMAELLKDGPIDLATIEKAVEILHIAGALPQLLTTLPSALEYGLSNFYKNWDYMIQDIYDLNPDVTLMVVGMSDNSLKGKNYDYNGVEGAPVNPDAGAEEDPTKAAAMKMIVDFVMGIGNGPMTEGARKFGYIYVDTAGTTYVDSHPDAAGHVHIANKIIEALPDPAVSSKFTDATPGHKNYKEIEFCVVNGIMSGTTDTTFSPEAPLAKKDMVAAFNAINGTKVVNDSDAEVSALKLAIEFLMAGFKGGINGIIKGLSLCSLVITDKGFEIFSTVTRAEAATYFSIFCQK